MHLDTNLPRAAHWKVPTLLVRAAAASTCKLCTRRRKFCLAVRTTRACLMFDCCEDAQRALLVAPHVRPSRITRIFISCLDGDQICGLPGEAFMSGCYSVNPALLCCLCCL